jgi:hypothetical protein
MNTQKIDHYASGLYQGGTTNTGEGYVRAIYATCDHKHKTLAAAEKCALARRKNDGMMVAMAVDSDGFHKIKIGEKK